MERILRCVLGFTAAGGLLVAACVGPADTGDASNGAEGERAREAVIEAHRSLVEAFEAGDSETFAAALEAEPGLLVFHPYLENRFDGPEEVSRGLGQMLDRLGPDVRWLDVHPAVRVRGEVAWLTSHVMIESPAMQQPFVGRGTEVWIHSGDGWVLAHAHWSENPEVRE